MFFRGGDFPTADRGRKEGRKGRDGMGDPTVDSSYTITNRNPVSNDIPVFTNRAPHSGSPTDSKRDCTKNLGSNLGPPTQSFSCSPSTSHLAVLKQAVVLLLQTFIINYSFSFFPVYLLNFFDILRC